jgi:hypothetical protein
MSLLDIWQANPELAEKRVDQIIAVAGSGKLRDGSDASNEFRDFLTAIDSTSLCRYADDCLTTPFQDSGLALQDIVNEIGRRLGFDVEHGVYRGTTGGLNHDGLWRKDGVDIVAEVKTTDAYTIDLNTPINYRAALANAGKISRDSSSVLLIVGREDTGALEAQVRGSKHAWDIRLISVDGLVRLLRIKESVDEPAVAARIRGLLRPQEFTKVDAIIDVVFATAQDVQQAEEVPDTEAASQAPANFHDECITRIARHLNVPLIKHSRVVSASPDGNTAVVCAVSREYHPTTDPGYWYAFHPRYLDALASARHSYVAFGGGSPVTILLIPLADFRPWLDAMNITQLSDRFYWHVHISRRDQKYVLRRKAGASRIDLTRYLLSN